MNDDLLNRLQQWYYENCDGDWEHEYGIEIGTLDNPGWRVFIDLNETKLEDAGFSEKRIDRTEHDWVHCRVEESKFKGACGPQNLNELLEIFLIWVESSKNRPGNL